MKTAIFRIIILFLVPLLSQASAVQHMYEVTLPVISQDKPVRQAAFEQAFIEVLIRVSGNSEAAAQLKIESAAQCIQQYRYLPVAEENKSAIATMLETERPKHLLWMQFDQGLIKKMLRDNALPVWGQQRPGVLLWIAVRDGGQRYVLRDRDQSVIKDAVEKEAQRRGLPVIWPSYDAEDNSKVQFADIWGSFWGPISRASERYNADTILAGQMNWVNGSWQMGWSMKQGDKSQSWELQAVDLQLLMASGIDVATNNISSRFAVLENTETTDQLIVQINGINNVHDYARAANYLSSLATVKNVYASQVAGDSVRFNVDMTGDQEDLQRIIVLGKTLVLDGMKNVVIPLAADAPDASLNQPTENILLYRFISKNTN